MKTPVHFLRTALAAAMVIAFLSPVEAGSIRGEVRFTGPVPAAPKIKVTKDQDYCGESVPDESYLVDAGGGLKNAVIFLDKAPVGAAPAKEHILEGNGCRFAPRVLAMIKGEKLVIRNDDPKLHIAHSYLDKRTVFNVSLPFRGQTIEVTQRIGRTGILQVNCDTHNWMRAYIHVFDHPFFAVSDGEGRFGIAGVPPGKYILKAWHEGQAVQSREVVVPDTGDARVNFEFK